MNNEDIDTYYVELLAEVKQNPSALKDVDEYWISNNSEEYKEVALEVVKQNVYSFSDINNDWAVQNPRGYKEVALEAVKQNGCFLWYINDNWISKNSQQYYEIALEAAKQNGNFLIYVNDNRILKNSQQYYEIALAAVSENGWALRFVNKDWAVENSVRYYKVALAAVKQNGNVLQEINQIKGKDWASANYEIVLAAVNENGSALQYAGEIFRNNTKIIISSLINLDRKYSYDQIMSMNKIYEILSINCKARNDILIYIYILSNKNVSNNFKHALFNFFIKAFKDFKDTSSDKFTLYKNILECYLTLSEGYTKDFLNYKLLANLSDRDYKELYTFLSVADPSALNNAQFAKPLNNDHNDIIKNYLTKDTYNLKSIKNFNIYSSFLPSSLFLVDYDKIIKFLPSNLFLVDYDKIIKEINIMKSNDLTQLVLDYLRIKDLLAFYKDKSKTKLEGQYVNIGLKFHGPECYTSIGVEALVDAIKLNKGSLSNTIYGKYDILDAKLLDLDLNLLQEY